MIDCACWIVLYRLARSWISAGWAIDVVAYIFVDFSRFVSYRLKYFNVLVSRFTLTVVFLDSEPQKKHSNCKMMI
jgi:hypothetical protein